MYEKHSGNHIFVANVLYFKAGNDTLGIDLVLQGYVRKFSLRKIRFPARREKKRPLCESESRISGILVNFSISVA